MLKVEKRHRNDCRYSQYDRAHTKCTCAYRAIGMLNGVFVRRGLKTSNYEIALKKVRAWEAEGSAREIQAVTIEAATGAFMRDIGARNWQDSTKRKFRVLLESRLADHAGRKGYRLLSELDLNAITEFRATWTDAPVTALKNIERLRAFFRFCVDREWVIKNPASKLKVKATVEEKEPFTPGEFDRIMQAAYLYQDGRGHVNQENAQELRTFILVLRYSGLRISDGVQLERTQLVPGAEGDGYGLMVQQQKVRRTVYIPLPDGRDGQPDVVGALHSLPLKNEKYFFWDGHGDPERAVNNWRSRLTKLFTLAELRTGGGKPFASKPHPHRFRHTFAAEYLNAGVPIETVSLLLGHASVRVTEKHYAKFNRARQVRIDDAVRKAWKAKRPQLRVLKGGSQNVA